MVQYLFDKELLKKPFDKSHKDTMTGLQYKQYSRYFCNKKYREKTKDKSKKEQYYCNACKRLFHRTYQYIHNKTDKHKFFVELFETKEKLKHLED